MSYAAQTSQDFQTRASMPQPSTYHNYATVDGQEKQVVEDTTPTDHRPTQIESQRASTLPALQPSYTPNIHRSIGQTLNDPHAGQDSPVMNETLNVIDEHMQDMNTPRTSLTPHQQRVGDDSESEYSSHQGRGTSYVAGPETDDEENGTLTEAEVKSWDYKQTANHLRELGVDPRHCNIFEEQEITGDVLLEMDQAFIYMREYDFGVMGRRLKTWHKIRDFQDSVRGTKMSRQTTSTSLSRGELAEDTQHASNRVGSGSNGMLPRIPSLTEQPVFSYRPLPQTMGSMTDDLPMPQPLQPQLNASNRTSLHGATPSSPFRTFIVPDSPSRPSAALIREMSHSRRHSSIDFDAQTPPDLTLGNPSAKMNSHKQQPSLDREWSMTSANPMTASTTATSLRPYNIKTADYDSSVDTSFNTDPSSVDLLDRGYFSGNELDSRKARNVLRKRDSSGESPAHSRQSSMLDDPRKMHAAVKRHPRLSSVDSIRDGSSKITSPAAKAYHSRNFKGRLRSASERTSSPLPYSAHTSPTVTNLEGASSTTSVMPSPPIVADIKGSNTPLTNINNNISASNTARRMMGLRATSEAVTGGEKVAASPIATNITAQSPIESPTGSNTPSVTSRSFEMENADLSSKSTEAIGAALASKTSNRPRPKTKKETSAYTRGLQSISPDEARKNCDYSGWMKKKSSSLLTTWKPRLFILRGRRLSYYYSEADTVERGIIDISGHKVLVASSDPMMTLHATITGAASTSPAPGSAATSNESSPIATRSPNTAGGPFYFKLVPPKVGISRAVQFTKPTIHYFQVDGLAEGRKWMGEMMKATIEHDLATFETTNKQKTISLAKARARRERPPALKETAEVVEKDDGDEKKMEQNGLKIQGLDPGKGSGDRRLPSLTEEKSVGDGGEKAGLPGLADTGQRVGG